jgi:drug/metabolite transporter (DMT)-like permease
MKESYLLGYWLAVLAALTWALPPNLSRPAVRDGLPPLATVAVNAMIAMPLGYLVLRALGRRAGFRRLDARSLFYLGLTGLCSTSGLLCMFAALATESVAATVAIISTYPLWNLLVVLVLERDERITWRVVAGTAAMVAGIVVVVA